MTRRRQSKRKAAKAGLVYINSLDDDIRRRRCGKGFTYISAAGNTIKGKRIRQRIDSLVIPPAWEDVRICKQANGHLQAVGTDQAGRRQYLYHERWKAISAATKFDRMHLFGKRLPRMRRRILKDLNRKRLSRRRVLAGVFRLLDKAHVRVGNQEYAAQGTHGATTLKAEHVDVAKSRIQLCFPGKSGREREAELVDSKVAEVVRQCEEIDGQFLFQYLDEQGESHRVTSGDVNDYLRDASGEQFTAKDFRTWWAGTIALETLSELDLEDSKSQRKRKLADAITMTAEALGNTRSVCRNSYIHPGLITAAESGELPGLLDRLPDQARRGLTLAETRFHAILAELDFC